MENSEGRRLGIAIVGAGGAVATTAAAGVELMRLGLAGTQGLPLAEVAPGGRFSRVGDIAGYTALVFGGWDVVGDDLATAAEGHGVLGHRELAAVGPALSVMRPWPAVGDVSWCTNADGRHLIVAPSKRAAVEQMREDLRVFGEGVDAVVVINLSSTERMADLASPQLATLEGLERAIDEDDPGIPPAVLYAYAAISEGVPFGNFTPSVACDAPALVELATDRNVPVAGKDGKTGQTFIKTVIAPGLRSRALKVDGWFSANILGNRDGEALADPESNKSKLQTKGSVLDDILGYEVEDHVVRIDYYRPRGDAKEAWDTIDLVGFLGEKMQLKLNFLCKDSILAAPLVLEIARLLDLASQRGDGGMQEQLGLFFKAPQTPAGQRVEHALHVQEELLLQWLAGTGSRTEL
ncbi:MAG: Inositol-3-phosphate synthase, partial [Solirubrobacterales bacterium]|nr:Inositol-3-phosphate synthase [Solirubrobacterales bacterium]